MGKLFTGAKGGAVAAIAIFLAAAVWLAYRAARPADSEPSAGAEPGNFLQGRRAPHFSLPALLPAGGSNPAQRVTLAQARGKTVFLSFWASWCRPCDHELPVLNQFYLDHRERGVEAVAISVDTDREAAERYAVATRLAMPTGWDPQGRVADLFKIEVLPTLIVIAPNGRIQAVEPGLRDDLEAWLTAQSAAATAGDRPRPLR